MLLEEWKWRILAGIWIPALEPIGAKHAKFIETLLEDRATTFETAITTGPESKVDMILPIGLELLLYFFAPY